MPYIGSSVKRKEDVPLLRGIGKYVGDIRRPGMVHAAVLRSSRAHARITAIDAAAALELPGVVGVLTAADMPGLKTIPMRTGQIAGLERSQQTPIATDRVRYVGEPVAVVVAVDRYVAEDALELVVVSYEELPVVTDARAAMAPEAPRLHDTVPGNVPAEFQVETGDVKRAFAECDLVVEEAFETQRHGAVPLETRGLVAEFDEGRDMLTVWGPTKMTHTNWRILSELSGIPQSAIHFLEPAVGGGFGGRGEFYPEDFLIPFAAKHFRRPVCWIEDRSENLKSMNQSRQQSYRMRLGLRKDGTVLAMDAEILFDMGGYTRTHGGVPIVASSAMLRGPLRIKNYHCQVYCVLTNKTPVGTYRSPGRYEANFVRERLLDMAAHRLGLDPAELRRRNLIRPEEMPYDHGKTPYHYTVYDSGDLPGQFDAALRHMDYEELQQRCAAARAEGRALGVGIGCFVETSGIGPWEYARVEVDNSGGVVLYTGINSVGQGIATALSQIVADEMCVSIDDVRVVHGDTAKVPYGNGSNASRSTVMAGSAAVGASRKVKEKLLRLASAELEIDAGDLDAGGRPHQRQGSAGAEPGLRRPGPTGAAGAGAGPGLHPRHLRRGLLRHRQAALPLRRPRDAGGGGPGDGHDRDPRLPRDGGRGPQDQSHDHRGADGRRPGPGHRRRALGGIRLRRGRSAPVHQLHGLPDAHGHGRARRTVHLHRGLPVAAQSLGGQGSGGGRHHRCRRGPGQRRLQRPGRGGHPAAAQTELPAGAHGRRGEGLNAAARNPYARGLPDADAVAVAAATRAG